MNPNSLPAGFSKEFFLGLKAAEAGGKKILEVYNTKFFFEIKEDGGPVTSADILSQKAIKEILDNSGYCALSEECAAGESKIRSKKMWIVDPLDGTSDFVDKTGEFAVLIGLVEDGIPCLGIIHQPVAGLYWVAEKGMGAYKSEGDNWEKISVNKIRDFSTALAVMSKHHFSEREREFLKYLGIKEFIQKGSCGLKAAEIACGNAELYFTFTDKIHEWDTAAAHCLIEEAGGRISDTQGAGLSYDKKTTNHPHGVLITNGFVHDEIVRIHQTMI